MSTWRSISFVHNCLTTRHSDTKIHEDAQKSSVLLCGFVSLW
jgi:hypothetical protein